VTAAQRAPGYVRCFNGVASPLTFHEPAPMTNAPCCPADVSYLTGTFLDWFTGNGSYSTLFHCMGGDWPWIAATVVLDLTVACGYLLIAKHWWANERTLPNIPARRALANMRNIFLFCGICGYVFIPVKMFWPAWRLYDLFMVFLVYFTWKYAWGAKDLKVIYAEIGRGRQLQEELAESKAETQRQSFFLNAVSHDLRTPLNGMLLQASVAEMCAASGDAEELQRSLRDIRASARAAADMLDSLLEVARLNGAPESTVHSQFGLAEAVRDVVQQSRAAADQKGLDVHVSCPPGLNVMTDRVKLERTLSNLVANAVKFTDRGSIRVEVESAGRAAEIHVVDTGVGIAAEDRARLFDEFFQVQNNERDRRKGFGLGLAIARRLAVQLGGDIHVESALGRGSRFTLALPDVVDAEPARAGTAAAPRPEPASVG
jgi:signal transduction histidine kinase